MVMDKTQSINSIMQDNKKDIKPYNHKRQRHGYWEVHYDYYYANILYYKCFYVKNIEYGYTEYINHNFPNKQYYAR